MNKEQGDPEATETTRDKTLSKSRIASGVNGTLATPPLSVVLSELEQAVEGLNGNEQRKVIWWIRQWAAFISGKKGDFATAPPCRRGDIYLVDFGVNVGSEENYEHFAVVVENNNPRSRDTVVVVPLSSYKGGALSSGEVYLGHIIPPQAGKEAKASVAQVSQIRAISKRRIRANKGVWRMPSELMVEVDLALLRLQFGSVLDDYLRQVAAGNVPIDKG